MHIHKARNLLFIALFASGFTIPTFAYVKHIRFYQPSQEGEANFQKLAFILETSMGNSEKPRPFYVDQVELSVVVDPSTDQVEPKLVAGDNSVELSFVANDVFWSIEPKGCTARAELMNKDWLYCAINGDKSGFALEAKPGTSDIVLHFGKIWQDPQAPAVPVLVTYGESPELLVNNQEQPVANRLSVAFGQGDAVVSIPFTDAKPE
jgi:hypothetical protein